MKAPITTTEGNWIAIGESVETEDGHVIADCALSSHDINERLSNAKMLAASKDMANALVIMLEMWTRAGIEGVSGKDDVDSVAIAEHALKKAGYEL